MLLRLVCTAVVLALSVSVAFAEELVGRITKIDGNKITVTKLKRGETGEETTLTVADKVKVVNGKFNKEEKKIEAGEVIKDGLKNERFTKIGKGIFAQIVTDDAGKVTEVRVFPALKRKPRPKDE